MTLRKRKRPLVQIAPQPHPTNRSRAKPPAATPPAAPPGPSPIDALHLLQKSRAKSSSPSSVPTPAPTRAAPTLHEYQRASLEGELRNGNFDASSYVLSHLSSLLPSPPLPHPIRLLDVGAIRHRYDAARVCKAVPKGVEIDATSIDLDNSHDEERVIKADFFEFEGTFDVVVLSLVLNFVGDPRRRGEMVVRAREVLEGNGVLFVVLPAACVRNSRYLDEKVFGEVMRSCGLEVEKAEISGNGKMFFAICRTVEGDAGPWPKVEVKRRLVRRGEGKYNNFCIIVKKEEKKGKKSGKGAGKKKGKNGKREGGEGSSSGGPTTSNQRRRNRRKKRREARQGKTQRKK